MTDPATTPRARARHFVILLGWVSLFADLCYEGMRGAIGGYLAVLGASATAVGAVAGTGEAIGYGLRYASGALADRTRRYWALTIAGYATNLVAVPLLALAGSWPMVAVLVGLERLGKAIRSPAKSTLTSFAAADLGAGKAFAINEAMDQIGGLAGPLLVAAVLVWRGETASGYAWAFCLLAIPAAGAITVLLRARRLYPDPRSLESTPPSDSATALGPRYRLYLVGVALVAIGLADWPLLAYHLKHAGVLTDRWLPVAYAGAMAIDGVAALAAGHLFDRSRRRGHTGAGIVALFVLAGAAYGPLVLASDAATPLLAIAGVALWSITRSATESIGKALIAAIVGRDQRGRAYGLYYLVWGIAWWAGSLLLGALYDRDRTIAAAVAAGALVAGGAVVALSARARSEI
ncbi:MAG: MFS transporter [Deltaproteobacteria bacterium]|nr:MAG: MFS transporter [Deltaproteobacteria bacterium]TMQ14714.1 MAG: MFS transporter [Deltaproteobacteria bacterium]